MQKDVLDQHWRSISACHRQSETAAVSSLTAAIGLSGRDRSDIVDQAVELVRRCRARSNERPLADRFLQEYGLSSEEGVALLCLVESLLRIPDATTADQLIEEKIGGVDWERHLGRSSSVFVNASTWALLLTGSVLDLRTELTNETASYFRQLTKRVGEPVTRAAMTAAVHILSREFVSGETIDQAMSRYAVTASYDMLGEGARTFPDAERYFNSYQDAIRTVGKNSKGTSVFDRSGVSIKLSALHPRIEPLQHDRVVDELMPKLLELANAAKDADVHLTIDAEESTRIELTLDLFEKLVSSFEPLSHPVLGLAVQAYSKRAFAVLDWLNELAVRHRQQFFVRLVKGAYWDTEIKRAQIEGLCEFPVFTRKANTDISYLACARKLLGYSNTLFPQFATHNAHTLLAIRQMASGSPYECQRLHGMGQLLYEEAKGMFPDLPTCRVYSPVGPTRELMAYLTRRLLENGANSSFVHRVMDERSPPDQIVRDPLTIVAENQTTSHPDIPLPIDLYRPERPNSIGVDFGDSHQRRSLLSNLAKRGRIESDMSVAMSSQVSVEQNFERAVAAFSHWSQLSVETRSNRLVEFADALHEHRAELVYLLQSEARKTLADAIGEIREAEDFVRYYAASARNILAAQEMPSPTGETNILTLVPRGVIGCISPWNFPAAIFLGQIVAALAAGNTVVAKPAPQTPRIAERIIQILSRVDSTDSVVQLAVGDDSVGRSIVRHPQLAGIVFTGSVPVAKSIAKDLANRPGPILPLVAETGGINAMIVDSSALLETLVDDVVASAFGSAGQRCSALRLLCVPDSIAAPVFKMLAGAMDALIVGDPLDACTDVGPLIDGEAQENVLRYCRSKTIAHQSPCPSGGFFVPPTLIQVKDIEEVSEEIFGPVLHVHVYDQKDRRSLVRRVNSLGYGLTFGIQSRLQTTAMELASEIHVGNTYINRTMTGAVVGTQPFGGEALSGTGPKAGGPFYLQRLVVERVVTDNVAATGGNLELLRLNQ